MRRSHTEYIRSTRFGSSTQERGRNAVHTAKCGSRAHRVCPYLWRPQSTSCPSCRSDMLPVLARDFYALHRFRHPPTDHSTAYDDSHLSYREGEISHHRIRDIRQAKFALLDACSTLLLPRYLGRLRPAFEVAYDTYLIHHPYPFSSKASHVRLGIPSECIAQMNG